jgi:hypothetical protein
MAIIKYRNGLTNWLDAFDDDWGVEWFEQAWRFPAKPYTQKWYDPELYDLVPKESHKRKLIEQKEKELKLLDDKRKILEEDVKKLKSG